MEQLKQDIEKEIVKLEIFENQGKSLVNIDYVINTLKGIKNRI